MRKFEEIAQSNSEYQQVPVGSLTVNAMPTYLPRQAPNAICSFIFLPMRSRVDHFYHGDITKYACMHASHHTMYIYTRTRLVS